MFIIILSTAKDINCWSNILLMTDLTRQYVYKNTFITIKLMIDFIGVLTRSTSTRFCFCYI